ncbi:DUF262 domain-containing protein [Streptococcus mutans]|uniref:DUF262 domain-containing protein n=1 Tax=Streptococcus mutans TaxID=1309 RepID=UPI0002B55849|nr:DUF262 domain-containing protein [Streptococcus mutans]EMC24401.1 hypothetical protein SMU81_01175 [Streptococcus mutans SF14]MDT9489699.1 DUF262 domain-containing protein [Streptococcus mutans]
MTFTTETRTISDIFQRSVEYSIPRYQRNYVWKEINWKELLVDIRFTMDNGSDISWSHFLGTIVLNKIDSEKGIDRYEIIDGQQRLTTIYILIIVIYNRLNLINDEVSKNRGKYIFDSFISSLNNESTRIPVIKNEDFDKDIKEIIGSARSENNIRIPKTNNYYKLYTYFVNSFKEKDYSEVSRFLDKLLSANVVEIISGQEEEIYNIFEVLNARGQKLKQIELLKNHIMKYIQPRNEDFIDQAKVQWKTVEDNANKLNNPDILINHFAKCYIRKQADKSDLVYRLIKEEVAVSELSLFLDKLLEYSKVYIKISDKNSTDRTIKYFNIKRNQQVRPLLSAIYLLENRNIISSEIREQSTIMIRNYFFAFNTYRLSSNRMEKIINKLSYDIYHSKYEVEFKMYLTDFFHSAKNILPDGDIKNAFFENKTFRFSNKDETLSKNRNIIRYILSELYSLEQFDTNIPTHSITIEHLVGDDGYTDNSLLQNLTLTTAEINSDDLRNKDLSTKLEILADKSTIRSNQKLKNYLNENGDFDFESRKNDILNQLFQSVFVFNPYLFHINECDTKEYFEIYKFLEEKDQQELLDLLRKSGKNFKNVLRNDPDLKGELAIYEELRENNKI